MQFQANGQGYPIYDEKAALNRGALPGLHDGMTTDGPFVGLRGASDTRAYPESMNSLHTLVMTRINNPGAPGKPNFWERSAYAGLILLVVTYLVSFLTNLAYVVVQERGYTFGIEYPLIAGLAVAIQLYLTIAITHRIDGVLQLVEIWMGHYSRNTPVVWQRLMFWVICMVVTLGGQTLAAWSVYAIQFDNSVTFAGLPTVVGNEWRAVGILTVGYTLIYLVFLHSFYNPEAASDKNNSNAPLFVGLTVTAVSYISVPYTGAGYSFERYIASSIISGFWPESGWVYAVSAGFAAILSGIVFYTMHRTTKDGESSKLD